MTPKDNILKELLELKSKLAAISRENIFKVPAGYFDGLAAEILKKIRTKETGNEGGKTDFVLPLSTDLSKLTPYSTPPGYFNDLPEQILKRIKATESDDMADELATLSPLLSKISKQLGTLSKFSLFKHTIFFVLNALKFLSPSFYAVYEY